MIRQTRYKTMPVPAKLFRLVIGILLLLSSWLICAAQENSKLEYGILIDNTGSMRTQFNTVISLGKGVAHQVHDHGPVSIFSFESEGIGRGSRAVPTPRIEHAQDDQLLDRIIGNVYLQGGQTTLLDAVEFMAERLNRQTPGIGKVIILITDGEDRVSEKDQKQVIRKLKESKTSVYAIGLVQELDNHEGLTRQSTRTKAVNLLKSLTTETGGRAVFPKSVELQSLLTELAIPIK